jgi:SanA protein
MLKRLFKFLRALVLALGMLGLLTLLLPRLITTVCGWTRVYTLETAPLGRAAIVFGAGLTRNGFPTPVLRDRVETAARLYFAGKVEKLLMSGYSNFSNYSEPQSMRQYALTLGVPADVIVIDEEGRRTYDTCYRAKEIYGLDSALLVTQGFHMPRALFLCNALGLKAAGVVATNRRYWPVMLFIWNVREQIATVDAVVDVYVRRPIPVMGPPQPMFPGNSQRAETVSAGRR